ncbi:M24 family metallopeptidase [Terricaulis sp.]|uniref:M24 family metallopeptidase n=1 Tax=Terricaulis sp. TaxID=2768686 RepID=UPI0037850DEC
MRELMRAHGFDALAFSQPDWFEWASNHPIRELAWERPFLLVVTKDERSAAIIAEQSRGHVGAEQKRGALWIDSVAFYAEQPSRNEATAETWSELAYDLLKAEGLDNARIGVDALSEPLRQAARASEHLQLEAIPREALRALRRVKHPDEIATMEAAASLSDWAIGLYREELRPGRLLAEVDYIVSAKLAREAAERFPGEDFSIGSLFSVAGPTSALPKGDGLSNGKRLEPNAVAVTTLATRLNGLAMELARPWIVGAPPQRSIDYFKCARDAQEASIDAAQVGRPVRAVHEAARTLIEANGFGDFLRLRAGHGIGVVMHDFPEDMPFNSRPLVAGETYAIEPGLYVDGLGGFRFADVVAIGAEGAQRLTKATKEISDLTI